MDHLIFNGNINQWENLPIIPTGPFRKVIGAAIDSNRMIVIGQRTGKKGQSQSFLYDIRNRNKPHLNEWAHLPCAPEPEVQAATSIDGKLVILNGVLRIRNVKTETNQMHLFDTGDMSWRKLPPTIHKRNNCVLASHGRYVYAFGGFGFEHYPQSNAERLNIDTLQWESLPEMPISRGLCTASACQDKIIIADDWSTSIFDTKTLTYSITPSMPIKCFNCSSVSLGKYMILTGKMESHHHKSLCQIQVFDCESQIWNVLPCKMSAERSRHASALLHRNHLVIAGGGKREISHSRKKNYFFISPEKVVLPLIWSLKGQLIILRCLVDKDRALFDDSKKVKRNVIGETISGRHYSQTCEEVDHEGNYDELHSIVRSLVSKDFPFDIFKIIIHYL